MIHNGIEYGMMRAFAEGFDILKNANSPNVAEINLNLADGAEVWWRASVVSSGLLDLITTSLAENRRSRGLQRLCAGFRRRPLDRDSGDRGSGAGGCAHRGALHAIPQQNEHTFAEKMLSAMRKQFGGHIEPK